MASKSREPEMEEFLVEFDCISCFDKSTALQGARYKSTESSLGRGSEKKGCSSEGGSLPLKCLCSLGKNFWEGGPKTPNEGLEPSLGKNFWGGGPGHRTRGSNPRPRD